jgi:acyl-CoA dehydrogenase
VAIFDKICSIFNEKLSFTKLDLLAERALQQEIISEDEAALLIKAELGRRWVIAVDDFSTDKLSVHSSKSA